LARCALGPWATSPETVIDAEANAIPFLQVGARAYINRIWMEWRERPNRFVGNELGKS
jgi:hypothetical protein